MLVECRCCVRPSADREDFMNRITPVYGKMGRRRRVQIRRNEHQPHWRTSPIPDPGPLYEGLYTIQVYVARCIDADDNHGVIVRADHVHGCNDSGNSGGSSGGGGFGNGIIIIIMVATAERCVHRQPPDPAFADFSVLKLVRSFRAREVETVAESAMTHAQILNGPV